MSKLLRIFLALCFFIPFAAFAQTFTAPFNLSNSAASSFDPAQATQGNNVYVTWMDYNSGSDTSTLFVSHSADAGQTFASPAAITTCKGICIGSIKIASGERNQVYLAWSVFSDGIYFSRSINGRFSKPRRISGGGNIGSVQQLLVRGSDVFLLFAARGDIYLARSTNRGAHFRHPVDVSNTPEGDGAAVMAVDGPYVYVAWEGQTNVTTANTVGRFVRSTDGGNSFSTPYVFSADRYFSTGMQMSVDASGALYLSWMEVIPRWNVLLRKSTNHGASFTAIRQVSPFDSNVSNLQMHVKDTGKLYFSWNDNIGSQAEVFFTYSGNGGNSFSAVRNVSNTPDHSYSARFAVDSAGRVNLIWLESSTTNFSLREVYFTRFTPTGAIPPPTNISPSAFANDADIALDTSGIIHTVWTGVGVANNGDIFVSRSE